MSIRERWRMRRGLDWAAIWSVLALLGVLGIVGFFLLEAANG